MIPRFLNLQRITGIAAALALLSLLLLQKAETRHWRKQSGQYEQLYRGEQAASAQTVANYRAAARAADLAAAGRVRAAQHAINERIANDYETRLAAARDRAERLRVAAGSPATDPCGRATSPVPGVPAAACGPAQVAGHDRLSDAAALIATQQALQLDELIRWVRAQAGVDPNRSVEQPD